MAAEAKTKKTTASVDAFLKKTAQGDRLADCRALVKIMQKASGDKAAMWGSAIVGFGSYAVKYADGRSEAWPSVAFSPRATSLVLYGIVRANGSKPLLAKLGKFKVSGSCLHIKRLEDIDTSVLQSLVELGVESKKTKG